MAHGRLNREPPPGVVMDRKRHGPASPPPYPLRGLVHLRAVLRLSGDVPVDKVCEDAARTIELLDKAAPAVAEVPQAQPAEQPEPPPKPGDIVGESDVPIVHPKPGRGRKGT